MKVYKIVSRHGYDSKARNPQLTHYCSDMGELICGRTRQEWHWVVLAEDQTTIATCKRCLERAAKKIMLNKEKPKSLYVDLDMQVDEALAEIFSNYHQGQSK